MCKILDDLFAVNIASIEEPDLQVEEGDIVLGVLSDNLKKAFGLRSQMQKETEEPMRIAQEKRAEIKSLMEKHMEDHDSPNHVPEDCLKFHQEIDAMRKSINDELRPYISRAEAAEIFLTGAIYYEFGLGNANEKPSFDLFISKGWQVVKRPEPERKEITLSSLVTDFLGTLFHP
ncbi:MAG: hypothetical protein WC087_00125 [Candidatus Paceibacterota bacterium]